MLRPVLVTVGDVMAQAAKPPARPNVASDVFRAMHGFYGASFSSKFATGALNEKGQDKGTLNARAIWADQLERFEFDTVKSAIEVCKKVYPSFAPTYPEFEALCIAEMPRVIKSRPGPALEMGQSIRSEYAAKARAINAKHAELAAQAKTGAMDFPDSLDGLKQLVACAVGLAGGDEMATLLDLDRQLAPRAMGQTNQQAAP